MMLLCSPYHLVVVVLSQQHYSIIALLQEFTVDRCSSTISCQARYIIWRCLRNSEMLIEVVTEQFPALWALSSRGRDGPVAAELWAAQPLGCH